MSRIYPSVFSHLGLSTVTATMGARFADSVCYPGISAASNSKTLPFHGRPSQAYQSLFGSVATGKDRKQFESQGNLFDYLGEDVKELRKVLSESEKEKLDHHLEAIEALQKQREGILAMSDKIKMGKPEFTDKYHASNREWPYIILGDLGGKLKTAGQYIQYPHKGHEGHHTIASWWLTLLHAAGNPQDGFGMKDSNVDQEVQRGPLKEILA
jgi:hypothetical protein